MTSIETGPGGTIFVDPPEYRLALKAALEAFFPEKYLSENWQALARQNDVPLPQSYLAGDDGFSPSGPFRALDRAPLVGIDFPVLLRGRDKRAGSVAVIGQDPLRNGKDLKFAAGKRILIGTPYAVHCPAAIAGATSIYWKAISWLCNEGWQVYLTDISKAFWSDSSHDIRRVSPSTEQRTAFRSILRAELSYITPASVIAIGKRAFEEVSKVGLTMNIHHVPHPSFRNRRFGIGLAQDTRETRAELFRKRVASEVNNRAVPEE